MMAWIVLIIAMTIGNVICGVIAKQRMSVVAERSFFQAVAVLVCWEAHPWR